MGKKKRAKKDPNAPKRPMTAYLIFTNDNRAKIMEEIPGIKFTEVAKEASKRWKELDAEAKAVYEDKNKADKVRYETEMKAYTAKQAASGLSNVLASFRNFSRISWKVENSALLKVSLCTSSPGALQPMGTSFHRSGSLLWIRYSWNLVFVPPTSPDKISFSVISTKTRQLISAIVEKASLAATETDYSR